MKNYLKLALFLLISLGCLTAQAFTNQEFNSFVNELVSKTTDGSDKKIKVSLKNATNEEIKSKTDALGWDPNYKKDEIVVLNSSLVVYRHLSNPNSIYAVMSDSGITQGWPALIELKVGSSKIKMKVYSNVQKLAYRQIKI